MQLEVGGGLPRIPGQLNHQAVEGDGFRQMQSLRGTKMGFSSNLQSLRSKRNMTQEQLAMLLGVSRQAISKWESEKAYPEMDKLLMICDLFGCTLDDLVLGDVNKPEINYGNGQQRPVGMDASSSQSGDGTSSRASAFLANSLTSTMPSTSGHGLPTDITGYDVHRKFFSLRIATGVAAIIAGAAFIPLFDGGESANGVGEFFAIAILFIGIVLGLALIIPAGMSHAEFRRKHPFVENFYSDEDHARSARQLAVGVVTGIGCILAGVAMVVFSDAMEGSGSDVARWSNAATTALLFAVSIGIFCFILFGVRHGMLDLNEYNQESEKEQASRTAHGKYERINGAVCGVIMILATIGGLLTLFGGDSMSVNIIGLQLPFWMFWVIGGLLCGVTSVVFEALPDRDGKKS
jgi:DNA-binding XRE family transcriptional regulator